MQRVALGGREGKKMKNRLTTTLAAAALSFGIAPAFAQSEGRVSVAITETISGFNPYADPVVLMSSVWCQIYGCITRYDFAEGRFVPFLAETVEAIEPTVWKITLRPDLTRHDGSRVTADDILHSLNYIGKNPNSGKSYVVSSIASAEKIDDLTVHLHTKGPDATLADNLAGLVVTSAALFEQHGEAMFRDAPFGAGPYKLADLRIGEHIVLERNDGHPMISEKNPRQIMYRMMPEPEARVTSLANGEVQIAQSVPPQLIPRVQGLPNAEALFTNSVEMMFLGMSPKTHPWNIKEARQAVAHAINREGIVRAILQGNASLLNGPVNQGQIGFDPDYVSPYDYNPEKARELLKSAGLEGVEIEFSTPVGRYTADRQIAEAMVPMLEAAGFKVKLQTPEWATLWSNVQAGNVPFYYMGRGSMIDPSRALQQYFGTGGSPRLGYSNPALDALLTAEREEFDPALRQKKMQDVIALLTEDAPAAFLWQHKMAWGVSKEVRFQPNPADQVNGWEIFLP